MNLIPYQLTLRKLNEEINKLNVKELNSCSYCKLMIGLYLKSLNELKVLVIKEGFSCEEDEIHFFKFIKPQVASNLIYFHSRLRIDLEKPIYKDFQKEYFLEVLTEINNYLKLNKELVRYYRNKSSNLDDLFFLRRNCSLFELEENAIVFLDNNFSTLHDHTISKIIAYEYLINWIESGFNNSSQNEVMEKPVKYQNEKQIFWSGSKVALVELIYALYYSRMINNGKVGIKDIIKFFENGLHVELSDYYHTFLDVKNRKINRTKFLDQLKQSLVEKMDSSDI